jgi:Alpha/beta hydrolase family
VREETPYAWASHPASAEELAPSIVRAEYTLDALDREAALPAAALACFRENTGLATTGFSLYGHMSSLGERPDAGWLARARTVVVLVPGYATARECWTDLALALVRDNPHAVVVTLDHSGFGDSAFAAARPAMEHLGYAAVARMVLAWTTLCGLDPLPTVLVGHSMAATGLFLLPDDAFGPHRVRIAITPMFTNVLPKAPSTFFTRLLLTLVALVAPLPGVYRALIRLLDAVGGTTRDLTPARRRALVEQAVQIAPVAHLRLVKALLYAVPSGVQPLRRMYFAFGATDVQATPEVVDRVCGLLRIRPDRFRWLASGTHYPHLESVTSPEGTLRNRHELVLLVDEARDEVSPERRESTEFAATVPASSERPVNAH